MAACAKLASLRSSAAISEPAGPNRRPRSSASVTLLFRRHLGLHRAVRKESTEHATSNQNVSAIWFPRRESADRWTSTLATRSWPSLARRWNTERCGSARRGLALEIVSASWRNSPSGWAVALSDSFRNQTALCVGACMVPKRPSIFLIGRHRPMLAARWRMPRMA